MRGDLAAAVPLALRCTNLAEETGATACVVASNFVLGDAYMRQGNFADAKIVFDRGSEVAEVTERKIFRPAFTAYRRSIAASMGNFDLGGRTFEEALDETREMGDRWGEAHVFWRRAETEAVKQPPDRAQMLSDYEAAVSAFEYMSARPSLARVLRDWGNALRAIGQGDAGNEQLRRALALFDEMGIKTEATEVRAALATA